MDLLPRPSSIDDRISTESEKLQSHLKVIDLHNSPLNVLPAFTRRFEPQASIILIGARASGKRSLGFIAASQLGRRFISESLYFKDYTGFSKREFVQKHGAQAFHVAQADAFRHMLEKNSQGCVIECGVATLAHKARVVVRRFTETHPVIHITRNTDHMSQLTETKNIDTHSLLRLEEQHRKCSNLEFYNLYDPSCRGEDEPDFSPRSPFVLRDVKLDFQIFIRLVTGKVNFDRRHPASVAAVPLEERSYTYSTVLQMSDILHSAPHQPIDVQAGEDAIELKIDALVPDMLSVISKLVSKIRRSNPLLLIYTVDKSILSSSTDQEAAYLELIDHGFRLGAEYIQVDLASSESSLKQIFRNKGYSKIIGTHHFETKCPGSWLQSSRLEAYRSVMHSGVDIIQFTQPAICRRDNLDVQVFSRQISHQESGPQLIAYNTGVLGKTSLIFNRIMTPVQAPNLPSTVGNGLLITCKEATQALFKVFELDSLRFHISGAPCEADPASSVYETLFGLLGLEHDFDPKPAVSLDDLKLSIQSPNFGGSIVSSASKVEANKLVHSQSKHAAIIGAVNTILPLRPGIDGQIPPFEGQFSLRNRAGPVAALYGENTEWIGMMRCFQSKLSPRNAAGTSNNSAIVVGAGGSARSAIYAMIQLGYRHIFVHNRTEAHAQALADHFNEAALPGTENSRQKCIDVLPCGRVDWVANAPLPTAIMFCIPSDVVSSFQVPDSWLQSSSGGVIGDVSKSIQD